MLPEDEALVNGLKAWVVKVDRGQAPELMKQLIDPSTAGDVLVARADMVFGMDHLRSALHHASKAMKEGRNSSDSLAMETLLYASGERQLSTAIKKMSPDGTTESVVVARLRGSMPGPSQSWETLPEMPEGNLPERLKKFGISDLEVQSLGEGRATDLVLERVALVDVLKK